MHIQDYTEIERETAVKRLSSPTAKPLQLLAQPTVFSKAKGGSPQFKVVNHRFYANSYETIIV